MAAIDKFLFENAGAVNRMESLRRWLRSSFYGLPGVIDLGTDFLVLSSGSNLIVGLGSAVISDSTQAHGFWLCSPDTAQTVAIPNGDPTNPRIDGIVACSNDSEYSLNAADDTYVVKRIAGTPAGSPSAPATPTGCERLFDVRVAAGATSSSGWTVTDRRRPAGLGQTAARMSYAGGGTFTNNVASILPFASETYDYSNSATLGSSANYVAPQTGVYRADGYVGYEADNIGQGALLDIYVNGASAYHLDRQYGVGFSGGEALSVGGGDQFKLNATDVVTWRFEPLGSAAQAVLVTSARASITRVG